MFKHLHYSLVSYLVFTLGLLFNSEVYGETCLASNNEIKDTSQKILICQQQLNDIAHDSDDYYTLSLSLAKLYQQTGDLNSARNMLSQVLSEYSKISEIEQIKVNRQMGVIYFHQRVYEQAFNAFEQALSLSIKLKNSSFIALGYNDLANIYHIYGDLETSTSLLLKSYDIHTAENNELGQASVLNNLGSVYKDKGDYNEAIVSYRNAYTIYTRLGREVQAALTLSNLGETFQLNGDPDKAIELLTQSVDSLKQLNSFRFLAEIYILLAEISVNSVSTEQAQYWLNQSRLTTNLIQSSEKNPKYWFVQGLIWEKRDQLDKAAENYEKAFEQVNQHKEYPFQKQLYTAMAELSEQVEDYEASSKYWRIYADTLNSQLTLKNTIHSKNIRSTFTFEAGDSSNLEVGKISTLILVTLIISISCYIFIIRRNRGIHRASKENIEQSEITSTVPELETPATESVTKQRSPSSPPSTSSLSESEQAEQIRLQLVELMHLALQMWEESTQTGKLELAQQSKIWSVGIDDGRIRARAMERYFGLNTLPQKPRWRSVVRTCNYVLQKCEGKSLYREELETNLKTFQNNIKRKAIIDSKNPSSDEDSCTEH
ncbi:tetratricopeptide repeat protein [Shewanella woodyi]|uniref:Tetratricopeptide TPR_2 repeat protein n=1 Tax=Shewanella woodyi (strain ATCC 51908 / MS32) TaxID=392500 RepID=B1KEQ0_SHEWM|nr:tetratricopeptide repeat protein [Shewanella woodyi]ACA88065.1 Tetratricopeptide TPR_2 repeat protein [Shewanella woodyi ATCC 51908]